MSERCGPTRRLPGRFRDAFGRDQSEVELLLEREVFGANYGVHGYTTPAQAHALVEHLELGPGVRLLDIGAGRGWPALYLAERSGCEVVLTDLPPTGLRTTLAGARHRNLDKSCHFLVCGGAALPFRPRVFDAAVHTDVL